MYVYNNITFVYNIMISTDDIVSVRYILRVLSTYLRRRRRISAFTINVYTVTTEQQAAAAEYVWCILRPYGTGRISYLGIARARIRTHTHTRARIHTCTHAHTRTRALAGNVYGFIVCVCVYAYHIRRVRARPCVCVHRSHHRRRRRPHHGPRTWATAADAAASFARCLGLGGDRILARARACACASDGGHSDDRASGIVVSVGRPPVSRRTIVSLARAHVQTLLRAAARYRSGGEGVKTNRRRRRRPPPPPIHVVAPRAERDKCAPRRIPRRRRRHRYGVTTA